MEDTYLVQRLRKAPQSEFLAKAEQVFGGGMLGLGAEAWKILQAIFSIDYMGAAEYEFGTIPRVIKGMAEDAANLRAFQVVISAKDVEPNWARGRPARTAKGKPRKKQPVIPPISDRTVYVLARESQRAEIPAMLRLLASNKQRLKCGSRFPEALDPVEERDSEVCGWLELTNGFFFFLDQDMWQKTTRLLTGREDATLIAAPAPA
jgi:hypothetical protein